MSLLEHLLERSGRLECLAVNDGTSWEGSLTIDDGSKGCSFVGYGWLDAHLQPRCAVWNQDSGGNLSWSDPLLWIGGFLPPFGWLRWWRHHTTSPPGGHLSTVIYGNHIRWVMNSITLTTDNASAFHPTHVPLWLTYLRGGLGVPKMVLTWS